MKTSAQSGSRYLLLSDEELIPLILSGQQQAFTVLMQRNERLLRFVLNRYLTDEEAIKEVVQDTFLRAYRFLADFRSESKFSTWLTKIAVSLAISRLRSKRYAAWDSWEDYKVNRPDEAYDGGAFVEKQEAVQLLRQAVRQLTPHDATALELFYFREQSIEEISLITGWTVSNIKSRLCRARQRLHGVLEKTEFAEAYRAGGRV